MFLWNFCKPLNSAASSIVIYSNSYVLSFCKQVDSACIFYWRGGNSKYGQPNNIKRCLLVWSHMIFHQIYCFMLWEGGRISTLYPYTSLPPPPRTRDQGPWLPPPKLQLYIAKIETFDVRCNRYHPPWMKTMCFTSKPNTFEFRCYRDHSSLNRNHHFH